MKTISFFLFTTLISLCLLPSCAPKIKSSISNAGFSKLAPDEKVYVLQSDGLTPIDSKYIGQLKAGDTGLSVDCGYQNIIEAAKKEARAKGANIIAISSIKKPNLWSGCYRIKAQLLLNQNPKHLVTLDKKLEALNRSSLPADADYAVVHFYRPHYFPGSAITYDIKDGSGTVLGKMKNGSSFRYTTQNFGELKVWAKDEEDYISLQLEPGAEYFLRCSIKAGFPAAKPDFYVVDNATGSKEYKEI